MPVFALSCFIITVIASLIFQMHAGLFWHNIAILQDEFYVFFLLEGYGVYFLILCTIFICMLQLYVINTLASWNFGLVSRMISTFSAT